MPFVPVVVVAALRGVAEALPISRSGHEAAARLWLEPFPGASLTPILEVGAALALAFGVRRLLFAALAEGVRAIARPALFRESPAARDALSVVIAVGASAVVSALLRGTMEGWQGSPIVAGLGLLATGLAVASTGLCPRADRESPGSVEALLVGVAHGIAVFPGASRLGAALTLLLWLGIRPTKALDLSFLVGIPLLLAGGLSGGGQEGAGAEAPIDTGTMALGLVLAFVTASAAQALLRSLVERRRAFFLALWVIPLGLALVAYARALPST